MTPKFRYKCANCDEWHTDIPALVFPHPAAYYAISKWQRLIRVWSTPETCVIDNRSFFVRGNLNISVDGLVERLAFGVWVKLTQKDFMTFQSLLETPGRENHAPLTTTLANMPKGYPKENLAANLNFLPLPARPHIKLEPVDHPLAVEQRNGIDVERLRVIVETMLGRRQSD